MKATFIKSLFAGLCVASLLLCLCASLANAQKLPPVGADGSDTSAPASGKKKPPRNAADEEQKASEVSQVAVDAFKVAYKKAGRPKMLFLVGMDRRANGGGGQGGGAVGTGVVNGPGVGENLSVFDNTGITEALSTGIGAIINDDGQVRMVDLEAVAEADKRDIKTLEQNDADAAIDSLARKSNADQVFYIKFTPTPPNARGDNDVAYRCICELKDLGTATKIPIAPFDWDGPVDNKNCRRYSAALAELLCNTYVKIGKASGGSIDMTIKIIQLPPTLDTVDLRKVIKGIDGVDRHIQMDSGSSTAGGAEVTFSISVDDSVDSADIQSQLIKGAQKDLGLKLTPLDQKKNAITLTCSSVAGGPSIADRVTVSYPDWYQLTDPGSNPVKERFIAEYKKNPVRIAVTVNWLVSPEQMGYHEQWRQPLIIMQGDPRLNNLPMGPQTEKLENVSSDIISIFNDLNVHVVNPSKVQSIAANQADKATKLEKAEDLATILKSADVCDYVCLGLATEVGKTADDIPYDFKMTNCNNGDLVGALTWPVNERILKEVPQNRKLLAKPENRTRYIAGQMLLGIERSIGGGQVMAAEIHNATTLAQVQQLVDSLKSIEDITTDGVRFDHGVGTFTIRYSGPYADLSPRLQSVIETMKPFKVVEINPSAVRLDAKGD